MIQESNYLEFMKKFGYINGSELCFLIVAFLDYKFYIFDKNDKITRDFYIYKKQALTKELLFYYPFNDDNLELLNKSKANFSLLIIFLLYSLYFSYKYVFLYGALLK